MEKYKFQAKSEDGLLEKALNELNVKEEDVITKTYEEKGGLFSGKKYTLEVVKLSDIAEVGKDVLNNYYAFDMHSDNLCERFEDTAIELPREIEYKKVK